MSTDLWQWTTLAVWLAWIAVYWQGGYAFFMAARQKGGPGPTSRSGVLFEIVIGAASIVALMGGLAAALSLVSVPLRAQTWMRIVGFCSSFVAFAGCSVVRFGFLRQWWSAKIMIHDDQQIVDRGPYAIVRHPLYALSVLTYVGAALVFPIWWIALACVMAIIGYVLLAKTEDDFMARNLPTYADYQTRVRFAFVPRVW